MNPYPGQPPPEQAAQLPATPPAPLLRPPVPRSREASGSRAPKLGLSIPPSPGQRPVGGECSVPPQPLLPRSAASRHALPQLRLATPLGSNVTPLEETQPGGRPALAQLGAGAGGDVSARSSRTGSFGVLEGRASGPSSASSASHSATSPHNGVRQRVGTPDPASAISSVYSEGGTAMERVGSNYVLPDLEKLSLELGREPDVEDLDDNGWMAASKAGKIIELGTLGEGAGGAVTKCMLAGGKTVFALKVGVTQGAKKKKKMGGP
jgi:mitogen-activated protein kinase kinase